MGKTGSNSNRRRFLQTLGAFALVPWPGRTTPTTPRLDKNKTPTPRNIIFILSDDHRYDFMSFLGRPAFLATPNMDRMAREGAHFQQAFVSTALCSPSRASIMTGLYAHRHGVVDNNTNIPAGTVFFPQYLQQAGYQTAFLGKWHMGDDTDAPRPGFNYWLSFRGQGVYYHPTLNINGKSVARQGYITDLLTEYALDWLQSTTQPFCLMLAHKAVHAMFEPAQRHLGRYAGAPLEYPVSMADTLENYQTKPAWVRAQRNSWHGVDFMYHGQMDFDTFYRRYCETLLALDESIGRILDWLDSSGRAQSTIVFYMGDNGFSFGEHGLIDKRHMYEESMRVPMLAYAPGLIPPGLKLTQLVQNIDLAPTILSLAGLEPPQNLDGQSLLPLLAGQSIPWRDTLLYEYYWERNFPQTPTVHGVRTDRYKYIHYHGIWDIDEFYDLQADPHELKNLIGSPAHQSLITDYNRRLFDLLEQTGGMLIPLKRDMGQPLNLRRPK